MSEKITGPEVAQKRMLSNTVLNKCVLYIFRCEGT